jgi:hypothetical protein
MGKSLSLNLGTPFLINSSKAHLATFGAGGSPEALLTCIYRNKDKYTNLLQANRHGLQNAKREDSLIQADFLFGKELYTLTVRYQGNVKTIELADVVWNAFELRMVNDLPIPGGARYRRVNSNGDRSQDTLTPINLRKYSLTEMANFLTLFEAKAQEALRLRPDETL